MRASGLQKIPRNPLHHHPKEEIADEFFNGIGSMGAIPRRHGRECGAALLCCTNRVTAEVPLSPDRAIRRPLLRVGRGR